MSFDDKFQKVKETEKRIKDDIVGKKPERPVVESLKLKKNKKGINCYTGVCISITEGGCLMHTDPVSKVKALNEEELNRPPVCISTNPTTDIFARSRTPKEPEHHT